MNTKRMILTGMCGALLSAGPVMAQGPGEPGEDGDRGERGHRPPPLSDIVERFDANGDGLLQSSEFPERFPAERILQHVDTDGDGAISVDEAKNAPKRPARGDRGERPQRGERGDRPQREGMERDGRRVERGDESLFDAMLERFDANNDGLIQENEAPSRMRENFARVDSNGDGGLDRSELDAIRQRSSERARMGRISGGDDRGDRDERWGDRPGREGAEEGVRRERRGDGEGRRGQRGVEPSSFISRLDLNEDGKLGMDELPERMHQFFGTLDADEDGFITEDEVSKVRDRRKGNRQ